jgi:hypothetical protein
MVETEWVFEARITRPDGVVVKAVVTLPAGAKTRDILELTQMAAGRLSTMLDTSFNEVPF